MQMAADKIHPRHEEEEQEQEEVRTLAARPSPPSPEKSNPVPDPVPAPPSGTYVIQIPKDQIYRVPPPENALRYKHLSHPKSRTKLRRCCCFFFCSLFALLLLAAVAASVFYLVFRPESPKYTLDSLSITSSKQSPLSPRFDITLTARNPNDKIGIYYQKGSSVTVNYKQLRLCDGALPQLFQPKNNVTVFKTALRSSSAIELTSSVRNELVAAEKNGRVPLTVDVRAPVKFKVGSIKSWRINVKVRCDLTADKLTAESKVVSKDCDYSVDIW